MKYVKRVDKLTKKQEKAMKVYADKWIAIGLKTGETDWDTFNKYMPICYRKSELQYPKNIVRVQSPLVGALAASVAEAILKKKRGAVDGAVGDAVRGAVRDAVGGAVDGAVRGAVGDAVRDAVRDAVETAINIAKKAGVIISWHYWLGGQFWVGYSWYWGVAFVNYFFDICKLKLSKDIMEGALAYRKVCESVNYIWPNRDFVMVCARPVHIDRDERGRLHSETRKAIAYPDSWGLYMYHGIQVPEAWILHPEKLNKEDWDNEKNLEKRRIIQEIMGDSFPEKIGAKLIAKPSREFKEKHNLLGLYEVCLPDDPEKIARYIKVRDHSSKREYYLRVKPSINDADEALAFTFQMKKEEYFPLAEA